jgi:hypothetical protein
MLDGLASVAGSSDLSGIGNSISGIGSLIETITGTINSLQGTTGSSTELNSYSPPANAVELSLTQAELIKKYNDAVDKVIAEEPMFDRTSATKVTSSSLSTENPALFTVGEQVTKIVGEELTKDAQKLHWPENGSVEDTVFKIKLSSSNVTGLYSKPKQAGNILYMDIGVKDPNVKMFTESKVSPESIYNAVAKGVGALMGTSYECSIQWARVYCALDISTGQFVYLEHDYVLKVTAPGSVDYPESTEFRALLAQGCERFRY